MPGRKKLIAYVVPMVLFVVLLALAAALNRRGEYFWLRSSQYWIYPIQTILCGLLLIRFRREYDFQRPANVGFVFFVGVLVFLIWIAPEQFFRFAPRTVGFNPDLFASQPSLYWPTVALRLVRLVIVVPLVEEIFWRGFLLRYLINENFEQVPFGTFSWISFIIVSSLFGFSHATEDWIAALITGVIYNAVAYRTKSLWSCVLTHATTNLLLGLWIMQTKQWGFW